MRESAGDFRARQSSNPLIHQSRAFDRWQILCPNEFDLGYHERAPPHGVCSIQLNVTYSMECASKSQPQFPVPRETHATVAQDAKFLKK